MMTFWNRLREARRLIIKKTFPIWERFGFHVTPVHFYEPIPDTEDLDESLWSRPSEMVGVEMNDEKQCQILSMFVSEFKNEFDCLPMLETSTPSQYYVNNLWFESVDGEILYCMIRMFKPKRFIEVGSGYSTCLAAQAILMNKQLDPEYECELVSIDPYPREFITVGFPGLAQLTTKKVQDIELALFEKLEDGDFFFIDSSHILSAGSDVQYLFLEVLPRLKKGVIVHIHDIFLPSEYPQKLIFKDHIFFSEQYLLHAFLAFNTVFEVIWAGSYMHLKHPDLLEVAFESYTRTERWPGSFWIRRVS